MARSRVRGTKSTRRLVRNIPDAMRGEITTALEQGGAELATLMRGRAPVRTGKLKSRIRHKVYPRTLRLRVGFLARALNRTAIFYALILENGRRAQTVTIRRGPRAGAQMRVSPIAAKRFIGGQRTGGNTETLNTMTRKLKGAWARTLRRAAQGVGND